MKLLHDFMNWAKYQARSFLPPIPAESSSTKLKKAAAMSTETVQKS